MFLKLSNSFKRIRFSTVSQVEVFVDGKSVHIDQGAAVIQACEKANVVIHNHKKIDYGQENYKILIIEDNKINMLLAKTMVKQIIPNSTIFEAINGKEGVDKFNILLPDLILMDLQMPIMNGYEATTAIRKSIKGKHIPIIAVSAGAILGEKDKCIAVGMNDYISKPIAKEVFENMIFKWINK